MGGVRIAKRGGQTVLISNIVVRKNEGISRLKLKGGSCVGLADFREGFCDGSDFFNRSYRGSREVTWEGYRVLCLPGQEATID